MWAALSVDAVTSRGWLDTGSDQPCWARPSDHSLCLPLGVGVEGRVRQLLESDHGFPWRMDTARKQTRLRMAVYRRAEYRVAEYRYHKGGFLDDWEREKWVSSITDWIFIGGHPTRYELWHSTHFTEKIVLNQTCLLTAAPSPSQKPLCISTTSFIARIVGNPTVEGAWSSDNRSHRIFVQIF